MIFVECDPDEVLVKALGITRKNITHEADKPKVIKKVMKAESSKGMVDEDPLGDQPSYIGQFKQIASEHNIKVLRYDEASSYLIVLCPRLEEWVLSAAKEAGVDPVKYGLPSDSKELKKVINFRLENFRSLVRAIDDQRSNMMKKLKGLLKRREIN